MTRYARLFGLEKSCPLPKGHTLEYCIVDSMDELITHVIAREDHPQKPQLKREYSNSSCLYLAKNDQHHYIGITAEVEKDALQCWIGFGHEEVHFLQSLGRLDILSQALQEQGRAIPLEGLHKETQCYLGAIAAAEKRFPGLTQHVIGVSLPEHATFLQEAMKLYWGK